MSGTESALILFVLFLFAGLVIYGVTRKGGVFNPSPPIDDEDSSFHTTLINNMNYPIQFVVTESGKKTALPTLSPNGYYPRTLPVGINIEVIHPSDPQKSLGSKQITQAYQYIAFEAGLILLR